MSVEFYEKTIGKQKQNSIIGFVIIFRKAGKQTYLADRFFIGINIKQILWQKWLFQWDREKMVAKQRCFYVEFSQINFL